MHERGTQIAETTHDNHSCQDLGAKVHIPPAVTHERGTQIAEGDGMHQSAPPHSVGG